MEDKNSKPKVSVCMLTFNHEKWIAKAIEGVIMQSTEFDYELVISDDCSTDSTSEIIDNYVSHYPQKIRYYRNAINIGLGSNFPETLNRCHGKFIAICEGDDFWTSPFKLQLQVNYMEQNPDCVLICHDYSTLYDAENRTESSSRAIVNFSFNQNRFLEDWITQPLTCLFRNLYHDYTFIHREGIFCDLILFYELLKHGNGYFLNEDMATFRVSRGALSSGLSAWQWSRNHVTMYDHLFRFNKHDKNLQRLSRKHCLTLYIYRMQGIDGDKLDFKPLKEYFRRSPMLIEGLVTIFIKVPYYLTRYLVFHRLKTYFR
jgi:glycosyltransferase involved in cell wall biosynthesis